MTLLNVVKLSLTFRFYTSAFGYRETNAFLTYALISQVIKTAILVCLEEKDDANKKTYEYMIHINDVFVNENKS